ncbi:hypothetical protein E2C01_012927 [Portunus trituberculatus]|uniref:Uncharacterized protein n=1 Tax=Portunus trituberculatus TaxID=210409 RepID=A0A5B7DFK6_PORTR|nr:hypothetical protein [Portunus trituberculatus]
MVDAGSRRFSLASVIRVGKPHLVPWHPMGLHGRTPEQSRIGIVARGSPAPRASTPVSGCGLFFTGRGCRLNPNQLGQPWGGTLVSLRIKTQAAQERTEREVTWRGRLPDPRAPPYPLHHRLLSTPTYKLSE